MPAKLIIPAALLISAFAMSPTHTAAADGASELIIKWVLLEACADNQSCRDSVETQFSSCLEKSDYQAFIDASSAEEEDLHLDHTMDLMSQCIVDENGKPYFVFAAQ